MSCFVGVLSRFSLAQAHTRADPNVAVKRLAAEIFTAAGWNRAPTVED